MLAGREDGPEHGRQVGERAEIEGQPHPERNGLAGRPAVTAGREEIIEQPGEHRGDDRAQPDEERLHGEAARALRGRQQIGDEGAEGLHADVDGGIHHPQQPGRHPERARAGHGDQREGGEQRAGEEVGAAPTQTVAGAVAQGADGGLHEQPGQRGGEPQDGDLVPVGAKVFVDGAHVGHLARPADLDAQKAEAHVPDLPEAQAKSRGFSGHLSSRDYLMSRTCPSWGPSASGSCLPGPSLPRVFSARRSLTAAPGGAVSSVTASPTAVRPKLTAVTWVPAPPGSRWTMTTRPRALTAGSATCSLSLMRYCARTRSILRSSEANESGRLSCSGSAP